jgi:RNA polymerase sigma-70 factor (ECF subfamily)
MTDPGSADDLDLASRVAAGDEEALEVLYARYADPLFAFIYHHADLSRADAEDVWQETLVAAIRALPGYRGESRLFTWLCGIARHKLIDHRRRAGRPATPPEGERGRSLAQAIDLTPLPDALLEQQAVRVAVVEALAMLPEDYRAALVGRYAEERSVDEVARLLGRSYKATESLLGRARLAFRNAIRGDHESTG